MAFQEECMTLSKKVWDTFVNTVWILFGWKNVYMKRNWETKPEGKIRGHVLGWEP
jgi:hypothetical protein